MLAAATAAITGISALAADGEANEWPQSHFGWGADVTSAIDMTGQDMSTLNIGAALGYKNRAIQIAGVGGQIDIAVGNNSRFYPVFALVRTSFTQRPSRCFMEVKAGYSFNRMDDKADHNGIYASAAWGINLAMSRNYRSYITLGYVYRQISGHGYKDVSAVSAGIGINF